MRRALIGLVVVAVVGGMPAPAGAQDCPAPVLEGFTRPADEPLPGDADAVPIRVGVPTSVVVHARGAERVVVDWGDGAQTTARFGEATAVAGHTFLRVGTSRAVATVTAPCGAATAGAVRLVVFGPCASATGVAVQFPDCDDERGRLRLGAHGLQTLGTWLSGPCRDSPSSGPIVPPEPIARAAACAARSGAPPVAGRLPVRAGRALSVELGAPASAVTVRVAGRRLGARALSESGRRWRVRLPRSLGRATRVRVRAVRDGGADTWVAGVRIR